MIIDMHGLYSHLPSFQLSTRIRESEALIYVTCTLVGSSVRKVTAPEHCRESSINARYCCYGYPKFGLFSSSKQRGILHMVEIKYCLFVLYKLLIMSPLNRQYG